MGMAVYFLCDILVILFSSSEYLAEKLLTNFVPAYSLVITKFSFLFNENDT